MHRSDRQFRPLAMLATAMMLVVACGTDTSPSTSSGTAKPGGKLTIASWQEPQTLLDGGITSTLSHAIADVAPAMEGLLNIAPAADVPKTNPKFTDIWKPQLATEFPTLENGGVKVKGTKMDVTWKLKHGVKWHDGEPFTSKDVKATADFSYLKFQDKNPTPVQTTTGWDLIESVDTPDDFTAVFHFKEIYASYYGLGSGPFGILPEHLLKKTYADPSQDMTKAKLAIDLSAAGGYKGTDTWDKWLVGTGPFIFKEWVNGDHITYVKNPNYHGTKANLDTLVIKFEPDTSTQLADLRTGTIDMGMDFRFALIPGIQHAPGLTLVVIPSNGAEHLLFNLDNRLLKDKVIRKAILMGIDRQKIVDSLLFGKSSVPPDSWLCLGAASWCADSSVPTTKFDPIQANKDLDAAGYKKGKDGIRVYSDGKPISLKLQTTSGNALREQQQVVIADDLKFIGIDIIKPFENVRSGKFFAGFGTGGTLATGNFDIGLFTQTFSGGEVDAAFDGYVSTQIPSATNGAGQNWGRLRDPKVDAAFKAGRNTVKLEDRKKAYVDAQKALADAIEEVPLYAQGQVFGVGKKFGGYKFNPDYWTTNAAEWFVK